MKDLFNLEFAVQFLIHQETKIDPLFVRCFNDLSLADDFEKRLKFAFPLFKELFGCDFYCTRLNKVVFGTKNYNEDGVKDNCV